ncbi:MAG: histidine kinase [Saprospiraceae bacterium]|nr:histidine kinase [Saprospiraceae bacterium]
MNRASEILGFSDRWLVIIGVPVVAMLTGLLMFADVLVASPRAFFTTCFLVGLAYTAIYWLVFRFACVYWRSKYPKLEQSGKRILYLALSVVIGYFLLKIVLDPFLHKPFENELGVAKLEHEIAMSVASLLVTFLVLGIYEGVGLFNLLKTAQLEKERLLKENMQSQLESLRNQVNPHFFFNSLNTLAYLIPEDSGKAVNFVRKLSQTYRYILDVRERELVSLEEELNFLKAFVSLLKERFGENLQVEIAVQPQLLQYQTLPLALQMLMENAIKHNIVSAQHPCTFISAPKGTIGWWCGTNSSASPTPNRVRAPASTISAIAAAS